VSCIVPCEFDHEIREMAAKMAPRIVRYNDLAEPSWTRPYPREEVERLIAHGTRRLEFLWGEPDPEIFEYAQLAEDRWYYGLSASKAGGTRRDPVALGINSVDFVLDGWDIHLPATFRCPVHPLEDIQVR
jgi:hypothetical protein